MSWQIIRKIRLNKTKAWYFKGIKNFYKLQQNVCFDFWQWKDDSSRHGGKTLISDVDKQLLRWQIDKRVIWTQRLSDEISRVVDALCCAEIFAFLYCEVQQWKVNLLEYCTIGKNLNSTWVFPFYCTSTIYIYIIWYNTFSILSFTFTIFILHLFLCFLYSFS